MIGKANSLDWMAEIDGLTPVQQTLKEVKGTLRAHFEIVDWQGIDILLAIACAHYTPGEMLWIRFLGASRSGKTELLSAISASPDCEDLEVFTPAALRGGLRRGAKVLNRLDGKLVITKDAAALISNRTDVKSEIFGLLRNIKDGKLTADFGSDEGHLVQVSRFDWIIAATQSGMENQRLMEGLLGQRFIDLRWIPGDREEMAIGAALNNKHLPSIRADLAAGIQSLMCQAKQEAESNDYELTFDDVRCIARIADRTAILRTPVFRDMHGNISGIPELEVGTDLAQGFSRVVKGLRYIGIADFKPYIQRLGRDCIPSMRVSLLKHLEDKDCTIDELIKLTNLPKGTVRQQIAQLKMLNAVKDGFGDTKTCLLGLPGASGY